MRALLALLLLETSLVVSAQESNEVMVWGAGTTSCGQFIKVMAENQRNEATFGQWLHGYLTALNSAKRSVVDHAVGIDRSGLIAWITDYCKSKPLDSFYEATEALVQQLQKDGRIRAKKTK